MYFFLDCTFGILRGNGVHLQLTLSTLLTYTVTDWGFGTVYRPLLISNLCALVRNLDNACLS